MIAVQTSDHLHSGPTYMAVKNDADLYLFAIGWIIAQWRDAEELSLAAMAKRYGLSRTGYMKYETGESPNFRKLCEILEDQGKDIASVMALARVFVRAIQEEEDAQKRELSSKERADVIELLYSAI